MATVSLPGLQAAVAEIGLAPFPSFPSFVEADVLSNPIDIFHAYLAEHLQSYVECDPQLVYNSIQASNTVENGDLDIVLPKLKLPGVSPKDLAGQLLKKFQPHPLFTAPFKDGIHIRFQVSSQTLPRLLLPYISDRKAEYGTFKSFGLQSEPQSERQKVIVEFSSPNIAREFTGAHLRSTVLGALVSNLYDKMGYTVVRINYLGDWGKNIGLLGVGWKKYGLGKDLDQQTDLFRYMHELYAKMEDELEPEQEARKKAREAGEDTSVLESQGLFAERDLTFKQIEDGEPEAIALWKKLRDITIAYYVNAYARLNIEFDEYSGESQVSLNSEAVAEVEAALRENGIYEEQNGAWVIDFDKHGTKLGNATLRNRNGSTTYLLRDIATVIDRLKTHSFDKMVYIVCEQDVHFRQVVKAVELMGRADVAAKLEHMSFPRGTGPPSPAGHVQLLGDILDQCETRTREAIAAKPSAYPFADHSAAAKALGLNSLLLQELSSRKCHSNGLDLSLLTLSEGDAGTSLQLCYARLCAAIANLPSPPGSDELPRFDYSPFWEPPWCDLLRLMARYPDVIHAAFKTLEPGAVLSYLYRLVEELAACLDEADEEEEGQSEVQGKARVARAVLYDCVRQVLENGMRLLGIIPVCT